VPGTEQDPHLSGGIIFLIPVGVAALGFSATIVVLSIPIFALVVLVSRLPFLDSERRSLEALAAETG
jgi:hypothetical protein